VRGRARFDTLTLSLSWPWLPPSPAATTILLILILSVYQLLRVGHLLSLSWPLCAGGVPPACEKELL
jgi:hypothetical protein